MSELCRKGRLTTRQRTRPITFKWIPWSLLVDKDCPFFWSFKIKSQFSSLGEGVAPLGTLILYVDELVFRMWTLLFGVCVFPWDRFCSSWIGHVVSKRSLHVLQEIQRATPPGSRFPIITQNQNFEESLIVQRGLDIIGSRIYCPNMFKYHRLKKRFPLHWTAIIFSQTNKFLKWQNKNIYVIYIIWTWNKTQVLKSDFD